MASKRPLQPPIPPDKLFDQGIADLFEGSVSDDNLVEGSNLPFLQELLRRSRNAAPAAGQLPSVPDGNSTGDMVGPGPTPGGQG